MFWRVLGHRFPLSVAQKRPLGMVWANTASGPGTCRPQDGDELPAPGAYPIEGGLVGGKEGLVHVEPARELDLDGMDALFGSTVVLGREATLVGIVMNDG